MNLKQIYIKILVVCLCILPSHLYGQTATERDAIACGHALKPLIPQLSKISEALMLVMNGENLPPEMCQYFPQAFSHCRCCNPEVLTALKEITQIPMLKGLASTVGMVNQLCTTVQKGEQSMLLYILWGMSCSQNLNPSCPPTS